MIHKTFASALLSITMLFTFSCVAGSASAAVDVDAAKATARASGCLKCHGETKAKKGPSYKEVADKYRGKEDAEAKLIHHVTAGEKVKFADGHEEDHKIIETHDAAEIKNIVDWILSIE
jgi:cytochrome c